MRRPCDRCRRHGRCQEIDRFLERYFFTMFKDRPAECPDYEERRWHGIEGVTDGTDVGGVCDRGYDRRRGRSIGDGALYNGTSVR